MRQLQMSTLAAVLAGASLLVACSSTETHRAEPAAPPAAGEQKKEPSLYTGQRALSCMSGLTSKWAADAVPVRLESVLNSESNGEGGKASVWKAGFISPSRGKLRYFTCSGSRLPDAPPYGASADIEQGYGADVAALAFQPFLVKTDSDKAFEIAQAHGGEALLKKTPDHVVNYVLLWSAKHHAPLWYVAYGKEKATTSGTGVVNAMTGAFVGATK
jgi:hypothetical protein